MSFPTFGSLVLYKLSACTEECRFIGTEVREKRRAFLLRHVPHGFPFAPFNIWRKFSLAEECLCFLQLEYPTFLVERKWQNNRPSNVGIQGDDDLCTSYMSSNALAGTEIGIFHHSLCTYVHRRLLASNNCTTIGAPLKNIGVLWCKIAFHVRDGKDQNSLLSQHFWWKEGAFQQ